MWSKAHTLRVTMALALIAVTAFVLAACGSSNNASTLLKQTFTGSHTVNSGDLSFSISVTPSGSSTLKGPITISFGGPFQSLGKGKLPQSDFTISLNALGKSGSLGILSTGTNGYVSLSGTSYQLPAASYQKLESSFDQVSGSSGSGSSQGALSKLGINPLSWLSNPKIVGNESVAGTPTTHIRADVNVPSLLNDLNTFLQKAASAGATSTKLPTSISPSTRSQIANSVQNPSFDLWTGNSDKTLRRMAVSVTVPVTGQISTLLGGLHSAQIALNMQYANLNQPQTIHAPTSVAPFTQFATRLRGLLQTIESSISGSVPGAAGGTTGATVATGTPGTTSSTAAPPSASVQSYSKCIQAAGQNVTKMQACAPLLNGGK